MWGVVPPPFHLPSPPALPPLPHAPTTAPPPPPSGISVPDSTSQKTILHWVIKSNNDNCFLSRFDPAVRRKAVRMQNSSRSVKHYNEFHPLPILMQNHSAPLPRSFQVAHVSSFPFSQLSQLSGTPRLGVNNCRFERCRSQQCQLAEVSTTSVSASWGLNNVSVS